MTFPWPIQRARSSAALVGGILALAGVAVTILLVAWINIQALEAVRLVVHSLQAREHAERFLGQLRDAETGQRGFLLTGRRDFLEPYDSGKRAIEAELAGLAALVTDNPAQSIRVARLRSLARAKIAALDTAIAAYNSGDMAKALDQVSQGVGKGLMDEVRVTVGEFQAEETRLLAERNAAENQRRWLSTLGIGLALIFLAVAAWRQLYVGNRRNLSLAQTNVLLDRRVAERTRQLENEKLRVETLLRDVNHRVGNNLAMVSALLNVQGRQARQPEVKTALAEAQSRIQAIAAGQRRLRIDIEADEIDARPYFEDLLAEIGKAAEGRPISLRLAMADIRLPGRDAVSYVVLVNELVTNAIKHAFPPGMEGTITVGVHSAGDDLNAVLLRIEDDGVGLMPEGQSNGLGQTIIANLLRSMRATMAVEPAAPGAQRPGTRVTLVFPRREAPAEA
ncbi:MAG: CHASE3 domain-containing protein [Rhizobiales bacterium]|nr:CHASE3 domain-containing protein [Hyphomicrobiales bacterium]